MLAFFRFVFGLFSPYADARERRLAKFLARLDPGASRWDAAGELRDAMGRDLLRLTVLAEWKFKGYRALASKRYRRGLYAHGDAIAKAFADWFLARRGALEAAHPGADEKELWLRGIMAWLAPSNGVFRYEKDAAFERLLRDPAREPLVGDCNQISTLYAWLWSLRFRVDDLEAKFPPGHACLRALGRDVECTAGTFADYADARPAPIEELCAVNVLDVPDGKLRVHRPTPAQMERAATFAFLFSSFRDVTESNLKSAWTNLANQALKDKDWQEAWDWFGKLDDREWRRETARRAALDSAARRNFSRAQAWAAHSGDPAVHRTVDNARGLAALEARDWSAARKWFDRAGEPDNVRVAWLREYGALADTVARCRTAQDWRPHRARVRRMRECAREAGEREYEAFCDRVLDLIG